LLEIFTKLFVPLPPEAFSIILNEEDVPPEITDNVFDVTVTLASSAPCKKIPLSVLV
jgi:hypothetical protein